MVSKASKAFGTPAKIVAMDPAHTQQQQQEVALYREPVTTPGLVPSHLKRATADAFPLIEVVQRFLFHVNPGTGASIEKLVALVALYKVASPVWYYVKELILHSLTSRISISESDPVAFEVIQWLSTEVISKSRLTTSATVATGDLSRYGAEAYGGYFPGGRSIDIYPHMISH